MFRVFCAIVVTFVSLNMWGAVQAASFVVKAATYTESHGRFRATADIMGGDVAVLEIHANSVARKDHILASLRTSAAATINVLSPIAGQFTIRVTVTAPARMTAHVSYTIDISSPLRMKYDFLVGANILNGYIHIKDESNSNARWQNATFRLVDSVSLVSMTGVNLPPGGSVTLPVPSLTNFRVTLAKPNYLRSQHATGGPIHHVYSLSNNSVARHGLPRGTFNVIDPIFLHVTTLDPSLAPGATRELYADARRDVTAANTELMESSFEVTKLVNGKLYIQPWTVDQVTLKNASTFPQSVRLGRKSSSSILVPANGEVKYRRGKAKSARREFAVVVLPLEINNKLDIEHQVLASNLKALQNVRKFANPVLQSKVKNVIYFYEQILLSHGITSNLTTAKLASEKVRNELIMTGAPANQIQRVRDQINAADVRISQELINEAQLLAGLAALL